MIDEVKSPPEPPADLTKASVAQKQFEKVNEGIGAIYNPVVFPWWMELYNDTAKAKSIEVEQAWNLNLLQLKELIDSIDD